MHRLWVEYWDNGTFGWLEHKHITRKICVSIRDVQNWWLQGRKVAEITVIVTWKVTPQASKDYSCPIWSPWRNASQTVRRAPVLEILYRWGVDYPSENRGLIIYLACWLWVKLWGWVRAIFVHLIDWLLLKNKTNSKMPQKLLSHTN